MPRHDNCSHVGKCGPSNHDSPLDLFFASPILSYHAAKIHIGELHIGCHLFNLLSSMAIFILGEFGFLLTTIALSS